MRALLVLCTAVMLFIAPMAIAVGLPISAGYAHWPLNTSTVEVGSFLGGVTLYWLEVAEYALRIVGGKK